ncbi:hypothetical protein ILUMI_25582, partial [Ignelater luminosus]
MGPDDILSRQLGGDGRLVEIHKLGGTHVDFLLPVIDEGLQEALTWKMAQVPEEALWMEQRRPRRGWSSRIFPRGGKASCTGQTATLKCPQSQCLETHPSPAK